MDYRKERKKFKLVGLYTFEKHIKQILLFIPVLAVSLYSYFSKKILGNVASMSELTYYKDAYKNDSDPLEIIIALGTVILHRMADLYSRA